jgi:collagenase-like PrtC family protease
MQEAGATRWVVAPELSGTALAEMRVALDAPVETEVFAWGRLPLAHSARCFTARHFNLQKDSCEFRCLAIMDGLTLRTREGEPFLTLNGVQTQSARVHTLLGDLDAVRLQVELLRISPQGRHTAEVLALFRRALDGELAPAAALAAGAPLMVADACNGFWHGRAGAEHHVPA